MPRIYIILITFIFSLSFARAELPYAQKILLNAEYDRTEKTLKDQISDIQDMRENIKKAKTTYVEARHLTETLYVYALESLHRSKSIERFNRLAHLLNSSDGRDRFYYPVIVSGGFSGNNTRHVAWKDQKCINPTKKDQVQVGVFIEIQDGTFQRLNFTGTDLIFTEKYIVVKNGKQILKNYPLAAFKIKQDSPVFPIIEDFKNLSKDLSEYYNCNYVMQFAKLERENKELYARYLYLAKVLSRIPVNFNEEKKEKTMGEELTELTTALPKKTATEVTAPAPTKAKKKAPAINELDANPL